LITELYNQSLFITRRVFFVRNLNKAGKSQSELLDYVKKPDPNNCVIFVDDDFYSRSKIFHQISKISTSVNVSPPFINKIKEWVIYILKLKGYSLEEGDLKKIIEIYGDSIGSVINEIEKLYLINDGNKHLKLNDYSFANKSSREFFLWNIIDYLGYKNIKEVLIVYESLVIHGYSDTQILIKLFNFFELLSMHKKNQNTDNLNFNKIIMKRLNIYNKKFTEKELENIQIELRNIDLKIKSTSIDHKLLFQIFFSNICKSVYV
tara:strand:+ start:405 stop:1193 length:789 start_codon:yes stop_codon:yes gene_type:complete